ncbi:hypothetical protein CFC35_05620 [Streptomyces sp. FBKL.4005]|uniref:hypothetical protein n=1 Tax=Streptomyces sp. FBKL.4005 TaxID=2015515 RepID=UPI000B96C8EF|nr:hypothetical protein [Streptomyces sp. FBKL.4005]OYP14044.1 hypothetical protein CFC35_05620 [Streptomyces sp. FBKL.4005]
MIREDRFLISRKPYAVDLTSLRGHRSPTPQGRNPYYFDGRISAVWFRRRKGTTIACIGELWDLQHPEPANAHHFLEQHTDGRYGGTTHGRWDGQSYWGNVTLAEQERHLAILQPMLANYPEIPPGYDGWWTFQAAR